MGVLRDLLVVLVLFCLLGLGLLLRFTVSGALAAAARVGVTVLAGLAVLGGAGVPVGLIGRMAVILPFSRPLGSWGEIMVGAHPTHP